jgi:WD40 repeat protein
MPQRLRDYEILEEIERGGMGAVYRARQVSLNREVAVKVLLGGQFSRQSQRFRHEAEMAASLNHPNIVSIYEVGEHEGQPFLSMQLIQGRSLAEMVCDGPLPVRQAAELLRTVAEAVHYAHERRVLHRDLKPSNILVDSSNVPHITDFGLAKRVEEQGELTLPGQVLGTPNYMPPEQADPKRGPTTAGSDIYSLGAILYHLLTARPPFMTGTLTQTLRLVIESEPVAPRLLNPSVSRDVETICLKCLEKEPQRRYGSARELADELGRFLRSEPIRARPLGPVARSVRWCRRKPALALAISAAIALLLVIGIGSPLAIVRIDRERKQEAALRLRAESAEQQTEQQLYAALLEQARATVRGGEVGQRVRALDALRRAASISNSVELRREVFAALALPDLRFERDLPVSPQTTFAQLDPLFERIAVCCGKGPVEVRAVSDYRLLTQLPASTNLPVYYGEWNGDGRFLAVKRDYFTTGPRSELEVWEVTGPQRVLFVHDIPADALAFHPRSPRIIVGRVTNAVAEFDLETRQELRTLPVPEAPLRLRFAPDGERFAALYRMPTGPMVTLHDATNGALLASQMFSNQIDTFTWDPRGRWLAVPDHSGAVSLMDTETSETRLLGRHKAQAVTVEFTPDGHYLVSGGWERELIVWDVEKMERAFTVALDRYIPQLRNDGRECALIGRTETRVSLYAFELPTGCRQFAEDLGTRLVQAAFSPDGRWLAASGQKRLGLWDLTGHGPAVLSDEGRDARLFFTPDSAELLASYRDEACFRWRIVPGTNSNSAPAIQPIAFQNPPGFTSFCVTSNNVVWTTSKGSLLTGLEAVAGDGPWVPTAGGINGASPDGKWLGICGSFTHTLHVYRLPSLEPVAKLANRGNISCFPFSPCGDEVAVASARLVEFWSTLTWQRTREITNFMRILYAPDARTIWLTKDFRTAGLYEARTLKPLLPLPMGMLPLALSPDGQHLAVSVDSRRLQVWDLAEVRRRLRELGLDWEEGPVTRTAER